MYTGVSRRWLCVATLFIGSQIAVDQRVYGAGFAIAVPWLCALAFSWALFALKPFSRYLPVSVLDLSSLVTVVIVATLAIANVAVAAVAVSQVYGSARIVNGAQLLRANGIAFISIYTAGFRRQYLW